MLFQTNTTTSFIASVLTYLTKNTLSANQQMEDQNNPRLQVNKSESSSQAIEGQRCQTFITTDISVPTIEKMESFAEKHRKNYEDHKKMKNLTKKEEALFKFYLILNEASLTKARELFKLLTNFTKKKYKKFLDNLDGSIKKIYNFTNGEYSSLLSELDNKKISDYIQELQEITEKSNGFFTVGVVSKKKKGKTIKTIRMVNNSRITRDY